MIKEIINEVKNSITIDIDYMCDDEKECKKILKKYKIKIKKTGDGTANLTGTKENLIGFLKASGYDDIEFFWPELK